MATLDNVKILIGIDSIDDSQDALLNLYITRSTDFILNYCNIADVTSIPATLNSVLEDIVVLKYQKKGTEGLTAEALGAHSVSFLDGLPADLTSQLNQHRRVRVI